MYTHRVTQQPEILFSLATTHLGVVQGVNLRTVTAREVGQEATRGPTNLKNGFGRPAGDYLFDQLQNGCKPNPYLFSSVLATGRATFCQCWSQ